MKSFKWFCTFLFAIVHAPVSNHYATAAVPPAYRVTNLGTFPSTSATVSSGYGINANGQVTGQTFVQLGNCACYIEQAFLHDGTLHALGSLRGTGGSSLGWGINDIGHVVGYSSAAPFTTHAFLYDGTMHDLGTLGGTHSYAFGINSSGQISGYSQRLDGGYHAYLWNPTIPNSVNGTMYELGNLGGNRSWASDVNDVGHVAGTSYISGSVYYHAFVWTPTLPNGSTGTLLDIGTLGGDFSLANAINATGVVVGFASDTNERWHAFLYDGTMHDLHALDGDYSQAFDINSYGEVVGVFGPDVFSEDNAAFVYTSGTGMIDLNTLIDASSGWYLSEAQGVNDSGQITGSGIFNGAYHAFLLTPVPEPASSMLLCALIVVFCLRSGRSRS